MKTFSLFGRKISIKFEKKINKKITKTNTKSHSITQFVIFVIVISLIGILTNINFQHSEYYVGKKINTNIIAKHTTIYTRNIKNKLQTDKSIKKYIESNQVLYYKLTNILKTYTFTKLNLYFKYYKNKEILENLLTENNIAFNNSVYILLNTLNKTKVLNLEESIRNIIDSIYNGGFYNLKRYQQILLKNNIILTPNESLIFSNLVYPINTNDILNMKNIIKRNLAKIYTYKTVYLKGNIIYKKGHVLTRSNIKTLQILGLYKRNFAIYKMLGIILFYIILSTIFLLVVYRYLFNRIQKRKGFYPAFLAIIIIIIISFFLKGNFIVVLPFGSLVLLLGILFGENFSSVISIFSLFYLFSYYDFNYYFLIFNLMALIVGIYYIKRIKNRTDIINAGFSIGIVMAFFALAFAFINELSILQGTILILECIFSGFLSGAVTMALLPYFENTFNILTKIKLTELGDASNSKILKEFAKKAPGSFQHVLVVSEISQNAAIAIKADSLFTRVAALYHDVGKGKRPNFFVENQLDELNPHDKLSPYMSYLIISSHTKDGVEIARGNRIPVEIRDIIIEHHGTSVIEFFYNKALKNDKNVNKEDFKYDGWTPRSKESAIIMLADAVEAAVRSIKNKTVIEIEKKVRLIVNKKIKENQLSDSNLTFKDVEMVIKSFVKTLKSSYHNRIEYPTLIEHRGKNEN